MPVQYTNRKGKEYYLHQGVTRTGKPKYHFSPKREGKLAASIPAGFEVYENSNEQVFLRKVHPKIIGEDKVAALEKEFKKSSRYKYCLVDVKENAIIVYMANQNVELLSGIMNLTPGREIETENYLKRTLSYSPGCRFLLLDREQRIFVAERYFYGESTDYWRQIGQPGSLHDLVRQVIEALRGGLFLIKKPCPYHLEGIPLH